MFLVQRMFSPLVQWRLVQVLVCWGAQPGLPGNRQHAGVRAPSLLDHGGEVGEEEGRGGSQGGHGSR